MMKTLTCLSAQTANLGNQWRRWFMVLPVLFAMLVGQSALAISDEARQQGIPTLAPMLEQVTPAVVSIQVTKSMPTASGRFFGGEEVPEQLRRFFENQPNAPQIGRAHV